MKEETLKFVFVSTFYYLFVGVTALTWAYLTFGKILMFTLEN